MTSTPSPRPVSALRARMIEDMMVRGFTEETRTDCVRHVRASRPLSAGLPIRRRRRICAASSCTRVTESLTTDLSRISGAFVIAHNTAFAYKGKAIDLRQIGRDLNVRYGLEGSVQRGGNRLRLNVQLIDCDTGTHLWAERFDKELADLFEMQDDIVARLAGQLGAQLVEAEARRAEGSPDLDSMDLFFRARALINRGSTAEYLKPAEAFLERALQLDPSNVDALAAKGWVDMDFGAGFITD